MGLFDRVVRKAVSGAVGGAVNDALEKATGLDLNQDGVAGNSTDAFGAPQQQAPAQDQQSYTQEPLAAPATAQRKDHAYFCNLLKENFAEYQLAEFVPVSHFGGDGKPYDFVLSRNNTSALAIMLSEHNRTNNRAFKGAKDFSEAAGVPFLNFFLHMANYDDYVIGRIKSTLG